MNSRIITKVYTDEKNHMGKITYLALFNEYVLTYSHRWGTSDDGTISILLDSSEQGINKATFSTRAAAIRFADANGITIAHEGKVDHPLAHGLPDTRSIRPY